MNGKIFVILFFFMSGMVVAQESKGRLYEVSPRVGTEIDSADRAKFNLFPAYRGFIKAEFYQMEDSSFCLEVTLTNSAGNMDLRRVSMDRTRVRQIQQTIDHYEAIQDGKYVFPGSEQVSKVKKRFQISITNTTADVKYDAVNLSTNYERRDRGSESFGLGASYMAQSSPFFFSLGLDFQHYSAKIGYYIQNELQISFNQSMNELVLPAMIGAFAGNEEVTGLVYLGAEIKLLELSKKDYSKSYWEGTRTFKNQLKAKDRWAYFYGGQAMFYRFFIDLRFIPHRALYKEKYDTLFKYNVKLNQFRIGYSFPF